MSQSDIAPTEERIAETAEKRRRRVMRRAILGFVLCIAALAGVRIWWGIESGRRLQNEIARVRDAGEPLLLADFNPTHDIPDNENAAILYEKAAAALVEPVGGALSLADLCSDPRFAIEYPKDALAIVQANAEALRLLRQARFLERIDWKVRFTSPILYLRFPKLSSDRQLVKFGRAAAYIQFREGDHAGAIETVRDMRELAKAVSATPRTTLIGYLVANACEALAVSPLQTFTHELAVSDAQRAPPQPAQGKSPATRAQVRALIRELLDDSASRKAFKAAMNAERATQLDSVQSILAGRFGTGALGGGGVPRAVASWFRPAIELDIVYMLGLMSQYCAAATAPNLPAANEMLAECDEQLKGLDRQRGSIRGATHLLSSILFPSFSRTYVLHFRQVATRRMAAVALALRLYELDHGRRPEWLPDLVPDYLTALPEDPFAADKRTFGYKPDREQPVLYSVGNDGRDDDGQYGTKPTGGMDLDRKDLVYFLNGDGPRGPVQRPRGVVGSGQAVEDYSQEEVGQGDSEPDEEDAGQSVSKVSDSLNGVLAVR